MHSTNVMSVEFISRKSSIYMTIDPESTPIKNVWMRRPTLRLTTVMSVASVIHLKMPFGSIRRNTMMMMV